MTCLGQGYRFEVATGKRAEVRGNRPMPSEVATANPIDLGSKHNRREGTLMDRRELLGGVSIFSSLGDAELDQLLDVTTTKRLKPKEVLCRKGDPGNQLYGILSGSLKVTTTGTDGKDVMFGLMGPGEVIGEIALLDGEERSVSRCLS